MQVIEAMMPFDKSAHPQDTITRAARIMEEEDLPILPVCEHGKLVGVLGRSDLEAAAGTHGHSPLAGILDWVSGRQAKQYMRAGYACIDATAERLEALELMARQHTDWLYVTKDSSLLGIVSRGDLDGSLDTGQAAVTEPAPWRRVSPTRS